MVSFSFDDISSFTRHRFADSTFHSLVQVVSHGESSTGAFDPQRWLCHCCREHDAPEADVDNKHIEGRTW